MLLLSLHFVILSSYITSKFAKHQYFRTTWCILWWFYWRSFIDVSRRSPVHTHIVLYDRQLPRASRANPQFYRVFVHCIHVHFSSFSFEMLCAFKEWQMPLLGDTFNVGTWESTSWGRLYCSPEPGHLSGDMVMAGERLMTDIGQPGSGQTALRLQRNRILTFQNAFSGVNVSIQTICTRFHGSGLWSNRKYKKYRWTWSVWAAL